MTVASPDRTEVLEEKIDALTAQVARIADEAREQRLRREAWDELRLDVTPLMGQAMATVSAELEDVQEFVSAEDLIRVFKRLLRNTKRIEESLERFESAMEFLDDAGTLTDEAFIKALALLEELEQRGYFEFAKAGLGVVDRVVTGFSEEDVEQLGDNVVLILQTVKEMTQPEIMAVAYRMIEAIHAQQERMEAEPDEPPSTWSLIRRLTDPEVRRGLGRALSTLSAVSNVETGPPRKFVTVRDEDNTRTTTTTNEPTQGEN
jgi:uncharacterized protein YjgD (DUF1641 family)